MPNQTMPDSTATIFVDSFYIGEITASSSLSPDENSTNVTFVVNLESSLKKYAVFLAVTKTDVLGTTTTGVFFWIQ